MSEITESPSVWMMLEADEEVGHMLREKHRLAHGVQAISHRDGVVLLGGPVPDMYSGYGLRKVLSQVLPLLDGEHTMQEIDQCCLEIEPRQIRNIVGNLFMNGLLRTGTASSLESDIEKYLDRMVGVTGVFRSGKDAAVALRNARLGIFAPQQIQDCLCAQYAEMEGGAAIKIGHADDLTPELDLLLVVAISGDVDPAAVFERANRLGIPSLNLELGGKDARLGPLVVAQVSASYACYMAAHARLIDTPRPYDPHTAMFWSAAALHMAMSILTRTLRRPPVNAFVDNQWRSGRQIERRTSIARLYGWMPNGEPVRLPLANGQAGYEGWKQYCSIALQTQDWNPANSYLIHFKPENIQSIFERVPAIFSGIKVALPKHRPGELSSSAPLSLSSLALLAVNSAGFQLRDGVPHRLVPTGGGLGSTLLMFLVRDVVGLEPGCYWLDAYSGDFERMKDIDLTSVYEWLNVNPAAPAVMLSFANAGKVARKYGPFSINISWYDSGVLLAFARNVGAALGLRLIDRARPPAELLMTKLGLPASALIPTGVIELGNNENAPVSIPSHDLEELLARISKRRATRSWATDVTKKDVARFCSLADQTLTRHGIVSGLELDISLLLLLKLSDGEDGFYEYRLGGGLRLIKAHGRQHHGDILSQGRLTEAPIIVLPQVNLRTVLEVIGDDGVETAYRAVGTIVGDLWLSAALMEMVGTACGGAFEGRIRSVTGNHWLENFAPLSLCLGPIKSAQMEE
ncbi:hypothetical protein V8J88_13530 [Massilia sp. W12]|uniref:hypothetical protein n=1 Tax=Massilia sp. W12 TaxID=3126507 RepID=UPI0030D14E46